MKVGWALMSVVSLAAAAGAAGEPTQAVRASVSIEPSTVARGQAPVVRITVHDRGRDRVAHTMIWIQQPCPTRCA